MKTLYALVFLFLMSSCTSEIFPIKGNYPPTPIYYMSDKTYDEVWDKLVDLFAQNGYSISLLDKASGIIISGNYAFDATIENKDGSLLDPGAYIVVPKTGAINSVNQFVALSGGYYDTKTKKVITSPVYGVMNVRIKKTNSGTAINTNLVNIYYEISDAKKSLIKTPIKDYRSTGVLEKFIADQIK